MTDARPHIAIIGAGIGGLSAALRLAPVARVTLFDPAANPGGKMRQFDSPAGPVDGGPTVLTMRPVFEALFAAAGANLNDHITLEREPLLARHFWADGSQLDLGDDTDWNIEEIRRFAGPGEAQAFAGFTQRATDLLDGFDGPMMQAEVPKLSQLIAHVAMRPKLAMQMAPGSNLARHLRSVFRDPRLQQLFGRYATYVGGVPGQVPALLSLIWASEAAGVWRLAGGMQALAQAICDLAVSWGVEWRPETEIARIELQGGRVAGVVDANGQRVGCDAVVFNGDPNALSRGYLGDVFRTLLPNTATQPRSLSAYVWHFAATPVGRNLAHHNVFFADRPNSEFPEILAGRMPSDPTLYLCRQGNDRFEIIMNGPAGQPPPEEEFATCQTRTFDRLETMGLRFSPRPGRAELTTPADFADRFPGSDGSLYGRSPGSMMAAFQRPTATTKIPGLYLAGGGVHPGAGVPMACLSGRHAAAAIMRDLALTSTFQPMVTPGGMSTESTRMRPVRSRSSVS